MSDKILFACLKQHCWSVWSSVRPPTPFKMSTSFFICWETLELNHVHNTVFYFHFGMSKCGTHHLAVDWTPPLCAALWNATKTQCYQAARTWAELHRYVTYKLPTTTAKSKLKLQYYDYFPEQWSLQCLLGANLSDRHIFFPQKDKTKLLLLTCNILQDFIRYVYFTFLSRKIHLTAMVDIRTTKHPVN